MANLFAWRDYNAAVAASYSGIEIEVATGKEIAIYALQVWYSTTQATFSVDAATLLDTARTAGTPAAQFGSDVSYSLESTCYGGVASTFTKLNDGWRLLGGLTNDNSPSLVLPIPMIVPGGKHFHCLAIQNSSGCEISVIFEERTLGASLNLPRRG